MIMKFMNENECDFMGSYNNNKKKKDTSVYSMLMLIKVPPLENLVDYS